MGTTNRFGLNTFGAEGQISDDGYKFSQRDRQTIDALLWTLFNHDHRDTAAVEQILVRGRASLTLGTGGGMAADQAFHYRYSFMDANGNETAASIASTTATPGPLAPPETQEITFETIGGTLDGGTYRYALAYYQTGGKTTRAPNDFSITLPTGTTTGSITITLEAPPADADGWHVYRRDPLSDDYYYIAELPAPAATFLDDGSYSPDCTRRRPSVNTTNTGSSITVTVDPVDLPFHEDVTAWRVYRSTSSVFGSQTLLATVTATVTPGGTDLVTEYLDLGGPTSLGTPLDQTTIPPVLPGIDAAEAFANSSGYLPAALRPQGTSQFYTYLPGEVTHGKLYNQFVAPDDMRAHRVDVFAITAPTGADATNHGVVRIANDGTANEVQHIWTDAVPVNEIQRISTTATGGTFTLTYDGQTTDAIDYNVDAADLKAELELLPNITSLMVSGLGTTSNPWTLIFLNPGSADVSLITANSSLLVGGGVTITEHVKGSDGGTFTLALNGDATDPIAYNASATTVATRLETDIAAITDVNVSGLGTEASPWVVEFVNPGAQNVPMLYADATLLNGSVTITEEQAGYGIATIDVLLNDTGQDFSWSAPPSEPVVVEAEDAVTNDGAEVSDLAALNDVAVNLSPLSGYVSYTAGTLAEGDYLLRIYVAGLNGGTTLDAAVSNVAGGGAGSGDIAQVAFGVDRGEYEPYFTVAFSTTGVEDVEFRVTNTGATNDLRVDRIAYEPVLPTFAAGTTVTVTGVEVGTPTTAGSDVQVSLWY